MVGSPPQVVNVQVFLKPKAAAVLRNEVLNAKWSAIPRDAVEHFKRGLGLMDSGKETDAEAEFRSAVSIAPNFAPAHTGLGNIAQKQGKYENAAQSFKDALRYDPRDLEANLGLGIADFNLRKFDEAEAALVNAAFIDRFAIMPHYYLGLIYSIRNDGDVAQKAFEKVRELDGGKSMPIIHKYLGRIYAHKQMNKQAITEFETYLSLLPNAKDAEAGKTPDHRDQRSPKYLSIDAPVRTRLS
jgi:tetratricopeptide (TPR) repeat protein